MKPSQSKNQLSSRNKTYLALAVFAVLIAAFYGNTLGHEFVGEAVTVIEENQYIRSLEYIPRAFTTCTAGEECYGGSLYYRPTLLLSSIFAYWVSPDPWFFHFMSVVYFFVAVFLLFVFVRLLAKDFLVAFLAALFFLIHPVQTEAVNYTGAVSDLLLAIFVLLTLILYVRYRAAPSPLKLVFVYVSYTAAVFTKEPALFIPAIFFLLDMLLYGAKWLDLFKWKELKRYVWFGIPAVFYLLARQVVLPGGGDAFGQFTLAERFHAMVSLFAQYITKLFYPFPLTTGVEFEKSGNLASLSFLTSFLIVAAFFIAFVLFLKKGKGVYAFSFLWFALFLVAVIVFLGGREQHLFAERYLFLSVVGFALAASLVASYALSYSKMARNIAIGIIMVLVVGSWFSVYTRNEAWSSTETLFVITLKQHPDAHAVRYSYAKELAIYKGDTVGAKRELEEIVRRDPDWVYMYRVYNNLGDIYREEGNLKEAITLYEKSILTSGGASLPAYNALGVLYAVSEEYLKALPYFCNAARIDPEFEDAESSMDSIILILQAEKEEEPKSFYEKLKNGEAFAQSLVEKVRVLDRECTEEECSFHLASRFDIGEAVLPFLIHGIDSAGEIVEVVHPAFDPQTGNIQIQLSSSYEDKSITFMFPTCQGIYYEASSKTTGS